MTGNNDRSARAGDYVLGLMDEGERARAERDLEVDAEFREAVISFAARMHMFDINAEPDAVPAGMWHTISERIAEMPQMREAVKPQPVAARPTLVPSSTPTRRVGLYSFSGWRGALMAACLAAACGVGYLAGSMTADKKPVVIVVLDTDAQVPGAVFEAFADDTVRIVPLEDFVVPEGKTMQVWTLYDQTVGPVSLGTLAKAQEIVLEGPHLPQPKPDQLYEITLEPAPGSPTGKPTGPILVKGFAKRPVS